MAKATSSTTQKGNVKAADVLLDWRVERIVLLGKNVARCFGFRDLPFLAEINIYGRRFLIFPHPSGTNRWWNERRNQRHARKLLQRFLRGETVPTGVRKSDVPLERGRARESRARSEAPALQRTGKYPNTLAFEPLYRMSGRCFGLEYGGTGFRQVHTGI